MTFDLSCTDATFPRLSERGALQVIADLGIPFVDICVFGGYELHFAPEEVVSEPAASARKAKQLVESVGLRVADVFCASDFAATAVNHPDAGFRARLRDDFQSIVEFAISVNATGITLLPGVPWPDEDERVSRARAAEELQWRAELAKGATLKLSIEPHYESIVPTPQTALELLEHAPDLMITLDYAHFVYQGIPEREVDVLISRTRHIQARQGAPGLMQARQEEGVIDFARIIRAFAAAGYDGFFSLEYTWEPWLDMKNVDTIAESAYLRDLFLATRREITGSGVGMSEKAQKE